jgi:hypothetical protein
VGLNCAALPETLLESELFGHEKGAFTGATHAKPGRIEQAAGGVLFLDEVAEMSPAVQAKLLRVCKRRVPAPGRHAPCADVRIVAATNRTWAAMARGDFREDVLPPAVFEIRLPRCASGATTSCSWRVVPRGAGPRSAGPPLISREARALLAYPGPQRARDAQRPERATIPVRWRPDRGRAPAAD